MILGQWGTSIPLLVHVCLGNHAMSPLICIIFPRMALLAWSSPGICLVDQPQSRTKKMLQRPETQCLQVHSEARHKLWPFLVWLSSCWR